MGELGGQGVTLGKMEHKILPSMGAHEFILQLSVLPAVQPIRNEPYGVAQLNKKLDEQAKNFLGNPEKGSENRKRSATRFANIPLV